VNITWLGPVFLLVGLVGTRTAFREHRGSGQSWWLLIPLAWLPTLCFVMSYFVTQG